MTPNTIWTYSDLDKVSHGQTQIFYLYNVQVECNVNIDIEHFDNMTLRH